MAQPDFRALAAQCRVDADASTLDNVRDRNLRAEAAWLDMAIRQERVATQRDRREAAEARASTSHPQEHDEIL